MTSIPHDLAERRALDAYARREAAREHARHRDEEDEHERILDEGLGRRIGGSALVALDEPGRIAEDAAAFARERDHDRTLECGAEL